MFMKELAKVGLKEGATVIVGNITIPTTEGLGQTVQGVSINDLRMAITANINFENVLVGAVASNKNYGIIKVDHDDKVSKTDVGKILELQGYTFGVKRNLRDILLYGLIDHYFEGHLHKLIINKGFLNDEVEIMSSAGVVVTLKTNFRTASDKSTVIVKLQVPQKGIADIKPMREVTTLLEYLKGIYQ